MTRRVVDCRCALCLCLCLCLLPARLAAGQGPPDPISAELSRLAHDQGAALPQAVSPAEGLVRSARSDRVDAVIRRMGGEIGSVVHAFRSAPAGERGTQVRRAVAAFSADAAGKGAARSFEGYGPALSVMRQFLVIPRPAGERNGADRVMRIISSFERSPKAEDVYYEYSDPAHLRASSVSALEKDGGSGMGAWQPPMESGRSYVLKKCRSIFILGWYCNTNLYQVRDVRESSAETKLLVAFLVPLAPGSDNAQFEDDRGENVVSGYTGVYVVTSELGSVLVYQLGIQSTQEAPGYEGLLAEEHLEEHRELVTRLRAALDLDQSR